jgi:hypothetical protein
LATLVGGVSSCSKGKRGSKGDSPHYQLSLPAGIINSQLSIKHAIFFDNRKPIQLFDFVPAAGDIMKVMDALPFEE